MNVENNGNIEKFYFYSKENDYIDVVTLMNNIAFPCNIEEQSGDGNNVNESLHNLMKKHIEKISREKTTDEKKGPSEFATSSYSS